MEGSSTNTDSKMKTAQVAAILTCWVVVTVTYYLYTEQPTDILVCDTTRLSAKTRLPNPDLFGKLDHVSKSEVFAKCVDSRLLHIGGLEKQVHRWKISKHNVCVELYNLFNVIFKIESRTGQLNITDTFRNKLLKWFGGNQNLVAQAETQTAIFVTNKWTYDATVFNPIREKRPIVRPNVTDTQYVNQLADKTASSCDFCNYKDATSPDVYGRIETPHCYTASNAFKLDAWHALVIFREHHPLKWTEEALMDVFNTAMKWFRNINRHHPDFVYPLIFWDLLPHASASQVHPHIHLVITNSGYWGSQEEWRQVGKQYAAKVAGRDYFFDLAAVHDILGLNTRHGSATAFASLTPKKDHEVVITSRMANQDFFEMIYYVTRGFLDDLERLCFSMSIALPAMKPIESNFNMPATLRVVTRGSASEVRSDVSSMELFAASNVNIDPFKTARVVSKSVENRSKR